MYKLLLTLLAFLLCINSIQSLSTPITPFAKYRNGSELMENVAYLWWTVDDDAKDVIFELHVKTTGWIALGIAKAGDENQNADMAIGWIDDKGKLYFEDRFATGFVLPVKDSTTQDWFGIQGREERNWTAIQFKRALDTHDPMDFPIEAGTNVVLFAYGLIDPNPDITYHGNRRVTRMLPLWKP